MRSGHFSGRNLVPLNSLGCESSLTQEEEKEEEKEEGGGGEEEQEEEPGREAIFCRLTQS